MSDNVKHVNWADWAISSLSGIPMDEANTASMDLFIDKAKSIPDELEALRKENAELKAALEEAHTNIDLKADFIDKTINKCAAKDQEIAELREPAERWDALWSSQRIRMMGSAGFDYTGEGGNDVSVRKPQEGWLHFGMEVWDQHPASEEGYPQTRCRNLLITYVDHIRAAPKPHES